MRIKKIVSAILALGIMLAFTACGSSDKATDLSKLEVGQDGVKFGPYTWQVLAVEEGRALIITEDVIFKDNFREDHGGITWIDSDIRHYLNDKFIFENFTEEESDKMIEVMNETPDNPRYGTNGGGNTKDTLFLLSTEECVKYFGDSGAYQELIDEEKMVLDDKYNDDRIARYDGEKIWWWLRSPGSSKTCMSVVTHHGIIEVVGYFADSEFGIRPAVWVDMSK